MNHSDGNTLRGGFVITLDTAGVDLIVDNCSPNYPTKELLRTDENDAPAGGVVYDDWRTANLTVQINASADQGDYRGDTFTTSAIDGTSRTWVINNQGGAKNKDALVTYDFTVREVIN